MTEQEERPVRLSSAEKAALVAMVQRDNTWTKKSGWVWESAYWTVRLMNELARKGLVTEVEADKEFRLTGKGSYLAKDLLIPYVQIPSPRQKRPVVLPSRGSRRGTPGRGTTGR